MKMNQDHTAGAEDSVPGGGPRAWRVPRSPEPLGGWQAGGGGAQGQGWGDRRDLDLLIRVRGSHGTILTRVLCSGVTHPSLGSPGWLPASPAGTASGWAAGRQQVDTEGQIRDQLWTWNVRTIWEEKGSALVTAHDSNKSLCVTQSAGVEKRVTHVERHKAKLEGTELTAGEGGGSQPPKTPGTWPRAVGSASVSPRLQHPEGTAVQRSLTLYSRPLGVFHLELSG